MALHTSGRNVRKKLKSPKGKVVARPKKGRSLKVKDLPTKIFKRKTVGKA